MPIPSLSSGNCRLRFSGGTLSPKSASDSPTDCRQPEPITALKDRTQPIRHVFFDIDDTLVCSKNPAASPKVMSALRQLEAQGIQLNFVTGRNHDSAEQMARKLVGDGLPIVYAHSNGAQTILMDQTGKRRVVAEHTINDPAIITDVFEILQREAPNSNLRAFVKTRHNHLVHLTFYPGHITSLQDELNDLGLTRQRASLVGMFVRELTPQQSDHLKATLKMRFPHLSVTQNKTYSLDITHAEANKGQAISHIIAHYGWNPKECAGVGDGDNDVAMAKTLREKGGVMIAMGNATDTLKEAAHYITGPVSDHGASDVAAAILRLKARHDNTSKQPPKPTHLDIQA